MGRFCSNCGKELEESYIACPNCGTLVNKTTYNNTSNMFLSERNIGVAIILSLITCGIYGIYWFIALTDEANKVSGNTAPSGGVAFLLSLVTCGLYSIYWSYKMGEKLNQAGKMHGKDIQNNAVLYLVLSIFGLGLVNYCLIQSDLNKFSN